MPIADETLQDLPGAGSATPKSQSRDDSASSNSARCPISETVQEAVSDFAATAAGGSPSLLNQLLDEQQTLTAVEEFSRNHGSQAVPAQARYYSKLLPASPPKEGQQYAFDVDLDRCSGCKACVTACHSLNGLDDSETWRDVGVLVGGSTSNPVMQHVTTACHHCLEPGCMSACPVSAYEKDPVTGIVRHLDDQCFGCQYCTLACPYDVPKYHAEKGIVRKCDMCSDRLAVGEAPACVQACPHEAIAINVVDIDEVRENAEADHFLPAAPEPHLTLPTTNYRSQRVFPRNTLPADYFAVNPQHPHWPLIVMLVLTQMSVGAFGVGLYFLAQLSDAIVAEFQPVQSVTALMFGLLALAASTMHLGRPQYAFRAVLGLRHSWLSREIVVFGAFAGAAVAYSALAWFSPFSAEVTQAAGWMTVIAGVLGVYCSAMIYIFTKREFWSYGPTVARFSLTTLVLGSAVTWLTIVSFGQLFDPGTAAELKQLVGTSLTQLLIVTCVGKLVLDASVFRHLTSRRTTPLKRSAGLMVGPLIRSTLGRYFFGLVGGVLIPLTLLGELESNRSSSAGQQAVLVGAMFTTLLGAEFLERYQFFAAVAAPRMPGSLRR